MTLLEHVFLWGACNLGAASVLELAEHFTAGWDNEKIQNWRANNRCETPMWMKPSLTRVF
ncbi:Hypothetical protein PDIG_81380 [Penicillium digitatum PHI26]|uniref:Uncharacterized protein n=2 Tax=Penicillium digitatum TaxID=36651 RepID=K9FY36_PEND2|nr:Hypothetical protein PDIP_29720 [Penicillium digitatum Pd1]EKV05941.1 Hypothetical protein PDIG_81380 [Penicillium digitatum PHI26]EKV17808.1 Hypothetical protein PDIP_29720 [Penicillium digitatum Pd1]